MFTLINSVKKLEDSLKKLKDSKIIACDLESTGLDTKIAKITGIGYGTNKYLYFIPFPHNFPQKFLLTKLKVLFEKTVIFHNGKYDMKLLLENKLPIPEKFHDTMIMSWLIDENKQHGLKPLSKELLGVDPKKWVDIPKEPNLFVNEEDIVNELAEYCCDDVRNTFDLFLHFYPLLKKENVLIDYVRIELKLIPILMAMEMRGISVDVTWLQKKGEKAKKILDKLEQSLIEKVKEQDPNQVKAINMRSPKQIENILFNVFKYPASKKTDTGKASTDNKALEYIIKKEKLEKDDFVHMLLKFRDLDKVHSTYLVALAEQAGLTNTIHANFMQHGTRTGRLSSNEPNMQNIPTRDDEWNIRSAFIAREGFTFLMADYSQIELRILAHLSNDKNMIDTFLADGDIHAKTMELLKIRSRKVAKGINFGIVYGMGPRTLAQTIDKKEDEAKRYIDAFFKGYPQVRQFINVVQQKTFRDGYVEMITGRRRRFYEIADRRWFNTIARQANNTKIQGSAADLIKIAMIRLLPAIKPLKAHMLLQIHDEIIIETPISKVKETKKVIQDVMEKALVLKVPIPVNIKESERWVK